MKDSPSTLAAHLTRLEKYIASQGLASRREAKDLIIRGLVTVNGKRATNTGLGIDPTRDTVLVKTDKENPKEYILFYKPRGIETSKTNKNLKDIHDVLPRYRHLAPIGRLDAESEGLILLSNDGTLTKALTKVDSNIGKKYEVTIQEKVIDVSLAQMARGVILDGIKTKPAIVNKKNDHTFFIVLHEGRKHQIRRMSAHYKWTVTSLKRVAIGHVEIGNMRPMETRSLSPADVKRLKA
ncbi:MAG: pseudouridylate synthase specific to ribosomal small subunit, rRNA pseudouridine2604 synthase [Candidatus Parcubacteria bacterium]|jgi:pseudouridine synthase